jgi:PKHD-type hydroxylase
MILTFANGITAQEHRAILDQVATAEFVDGRETAGTNLGARKNNQQIRRDASQIAAISAIVLAALRRNESFRNAVYPRQLHSLLVSRYGVGMEYGAHVDSALMGEAAAWRTDLSLTLFLNEPDQYDGGELALESGGDEILVKLPARSLVCYPTGQLHRVRPIVRGERLVVVAWIQSHVRDAGAREALADLSSALTALRKTGADARACDLINKTHINLLRRWADA